MSLTVLIEGPLQSDYSLAIANRNFAYGVLDAGYRIALHQRDNTTAFPPSADFLGEHPRLAPFFQPVAGSRPEMHTRNIYPPFTDNMHGSVRAFHCYAWEESGFPRRFVMNFEGGLDLVTVTSRYVQDVLRRNGVTVPVEVMGEGADHILSSPPIPVSFLQPGVFNFLHVSSCFPRKGADVLLRAFCEEFRQVDGVRLVIKTFQNPHNNVAELLREADRRYPKHAPVSIVWDSLSHGQMRYLLEHADCLVSASRGEGFGLPVAEAMMVGCPVIATIHGGQADLCSPEWCWPVEFRMELAQTHLTEGDSYWAEPSVDSLREQMRAIARAPESERQARAARAREHVTSQFTWKQAAKRHMAASEDVLAGRTRGERLLPPAATRLGFISTWNTKCGIAEYSRYLAENLAPEIQYTVFADRGGEVVRADSDRVFRLWTQNYDPAQPRDEARALVEQIAEQGIEIVSLQYNFGFFSPGVLEYLVDQLHARGIAVMITLHATNHPNFDRMTGALAKAEAVIVHRREDFDKLLAAGVERAVMQNQGIYVPAGSPPRAAAPGSQSLAFTLACFGFFLPPKGIRELLQAFEAAVQVNPVLRLKLVNSLYPNPASAAYATSCMRFIEERGLASRIEVSTAFLDEDEILQELSSADLILLPYTTSTESSSAAIRLPLASGTPILCSDLPLFDEFEGVVHRYPAFDIAALANRICELSADTDELLRFSEHQKALVEELSWRRVAVRFQALAASCRQPGMRGLVAV